MVSETDAPVAEDSPEVNTDEAEAEAVETPEVSESEDKGKEAEENPKGEAKAEDPEKSSPSKKEDDAVQDRITELNRKWREEQRLNEHLRKQLEEREAQQPQTLEPDKTLEDFDYDTAKYTQYLVDLATQAAEQKYLERGQQEQAARRWAQFEVKESQFAESVDDYFRATRAMPLSKEVLETVSSSPKSPEILYYLAKNPEVNDQIHSLRGYELAREVALIEAVKLVEPKAPSITEAPDPPDKIEPANADTEPEPAQMTQKQFEKWREKHIARR